MNLTKNNYLKPLTWEQIAKHVSEVDGNTICRERARQIGLRALRRVAEMLIDMPEIRDWAIENAQDLVEEVDTQ